MEHNLVRKVNTTIWRLCVTGAFNIDAKMAWRITIDAKLMTPFMWRLFTLSPKWLHAPAAHLHSKWSKILNELQKKINTFNEYPQKWLRSLLHKVCLNNCEKLIELFTAIEMGMTKPLSTVLNDPKIATNGTAVRGTVMQFACSVTRTVLYRFKLWTSSSKYNLPVDNELHRHQLTKAAHQYHLVFKDVQ